MGKSKKSIREIDAFQITDQQSSPSTMEIDSDLFGAIGLVDINRQTAAPIGIFDITPDPRQPRRIVPSTLRHIWKGNPQDTERLFSAWLDAIEGERGSRFDLSLYLSADTDIKYPEKVGPFEDAFLKLIELAVSIYKEGLTNPVTVAPAGLKYQLETGERRWLAYHLLFLHTKDSKFAKIAARTVDGVNLWRQAAENNARANLNAIGKARQLAVLLMDLLKREEEIEFTPIHQFEREQHFYLQVSDGERYRAPRNTSQRLLMAMGLKHPKQLREYRRLLELPEVVWHIADDLNWTEYSLRTMREGAPTPEELTQHALIRAKDEGYSVPTGAVSVLGKPEEGTPKTAKKTQEAVFGSKQHYSQVVKLIRKAGHGKKEVNHKALQMITEMRQWLEEQEQIIGRYES